MILTFLAFAYVISINGKGTEFCFLHYLYLLYSFYTLGTVVLVQQSFIKDATVEAFSLKNKVVYSLLVTMPTDKGASSV